MARSARKEVASSSSSRGWMHATVRGINFAAHRRVYISVNGYTIRSAVVFVFVAFGEILVISVPTKKKNLNEIFFPEP